jgi:hypothetical protein
MTGNTTPDAALEQLKSWGTRRLRSAGLFQPDTDIWTSGGSKRYLWTEASLRRAILYVAEGQGSLPLPAELSPTDRKEPRRASDRSGPPKSA